MSPDASSAAVFLLIFKLYVSVFPASAVTVTVTVLSPSFNVTFPVPTTFAFESTGVAYTVNDVILLGTSILYSFLSLLNPVKSYVFSFIPIFFSLASVDLFAVAVFGAAPFEDSLLPVFPLLVLPEFAVDGLLFELVSELCLFTFIVNFCGVVIGFSSISPNPLLPGFAVTSISASDVDVTVTVFVSLPVCKNTLEGFTVAFFASIST